MSDEEDEEKSNKPHDPGIKKFLREWDAFRHTWRRRPFLCVLFVILVVGEPAGLTKFGHWWGSTKGAAEHKEKEQKMLRDLDDARRERDSKATQLAPFLAIANQKFQAPTEDKRLELLAQSVETMTKDIKAIGDHLAKTRNLSSAAIARVVSLLQPAYKPGSPSRCLQLSERAGVSTD